MREIEIHGARYQVEGNYVRKPPVASDRTYDIFGALNYEIECYRCHNFGHIARNCRSRFIGSSSQPWENRQVLEQQISWKRKQEGSQVEECGISLRTQNSSSHWCVYSECSRYMTRNNNTFLLLQEKEGTITFGNNNSTRKPNESMERNNVERMKAQGTNAKEQGHSQIWMQNTEELHMGKFDHCKGDGYHMASPFRGL